MIIPYEVDVPFNHRPWTNYLIIAIAILVFVTQYRQMHLLDEQCDQEMSRILDDPNNNSKLTAKIVHQAYLQAFEKVDNPVKKYMLWDFSFSSLFGYMWLHADVFHIVGNLIFLWVFGNAVCSKIGNLTYCPVYVLLGMLAGMGSVIFKEIPGLGASGAINAIVGMYLVFFPRNEISCFYFISFRPGTFSCSSYWMVLYWFVFDVLGFVLGSGGVGYACHLTGFATGLGIAVAMLMTKWVVMEKDEESLLEVLGVHKKAALRFGRDGQMLTSVGQDSDIRINRQISFSEAALPSSAPASPALQQPSQSLTADDFFASIPLTSSSFDLPDSVFSSESLTHSDAKSSTAVAAKAMRSQHTPSKTAPPTNKKSGTQHPASDFIRFSCACGHKFKVPASQAGKSGRCPHCEGVIRIPHSSTVPPKNA